MCRNPRTSAYIVELLESNKGSMYKGHDMTPSVSIAGHLGSLPKCTVEMVKGPLSNGYGLICMSVAQAFVVSALHACP